MSLQVYVLGLAMHDLLFMILKKKKENWENVSRTVRGSGKNTLDQTSQTGYLLLHGLHSLPKTHKCFTQHIIIMIE